jgi:hypothetical protein
MGPTREVSVVKLQQLVLLTASVEFCSNFLPLLVRNISVMIIFITHISRTPIIVYKNDQLIVIHGLLTKLIYQINRNLRHENTHNRRKLYKKNQTYLIYNYFWRWRVCSDVLVASSVNTFIGKQTFICFNEFVRNRQNTFLLEIHSIVTVALRSAYGSCL